MNAVGVVMAGGHGTRFWPLSRKRRPKQLLRLFGDKSMVAYTAQRLSAFMPASELLVVTGRPIAEAVRAELPDVPSDNVIVEPRGRNTAPCVALAALLAERRFGSDRVLAVTPADHYIADEEAFANAFQSAVAYANQGRLVTLGITPTRPEAGYGYLKFGPLADPVEGAPLHARELVAFLEKPTAAQAVSFLKEGRYLWNSGIFFFRVDAILREYREHLPEVLEAVERAVERVSDDAGLTDALEEVYRECPSVSIDVGIMEKSERLLTIPATFGWSDVGNWRALLDFRGEDAPCFTLGRVLHEDAEGSVLAAADGVTLVAAGVRGLAVVACDDVTLVIPVERAQEVRQLVDLVRRNGLEELLE